MGPQVFVKRESWGQSLWKLVSDGLEHRRQYKQMGAAKGCTFGHALTTQQARMYRRHGLYILA